MPLRLKIFMALSLGIVVVAGVGFWSITEVAKLLTAGRAVSTRAAEALRLEIELLDSMRQAINLEQRFPTYGDSDYAAKTVKWAKSIEEGLGRLTPTLATEAERVRLRDAAESFAGYQGATARGRQFRAGGDVKRAREVIEGEASTAAARFETQMSQLIHLTQANLDYAQAAATSALTEAQVAAQRLERRTWYVVVSGLIVAVVIGLTGSYLLAQRMTQSLTRLSEATSSLAEGAFREIPVTTNDEIGQLARSFNTMAARLHELDQMKEQFYATVSHELRSPLTSARESAALLKEGSHGALTQKQMRLVGIIHGSTGRLLHLVNDVLDLSRISSGVLPLDVRSLDLERAAGRAVEELRLQADEKNVKLTFERGPGSFEMTGDENRIVQVLINLIVNAIRFTPAGGTVTVKLVDTGPELEAHVEDTGVGISSDQLDHIFERYKQAHTGRGGTGLGLAIVRAMVEAHGGRVTVESEEGKGSRFRVILPRMASQTAAAGVRA